MFPTLSLSFFGMDPKKYYSIHVDLVPVDRYNYTFVNNTWQVNAIASEVHPSSHIQSYQADEIVHTGLYWMKNGVDFKKIRLTNRRTGSFKEGEVWPRLKKLTPNSSSRESLLSFSIQQNSFHLILLECSYSLSD